MKVKRDFNERFQGMKSYRKGDEYTFDNKERVSYLVENGYLEEPEKDKGAVAEIHKDEVIEPKKETEKKSGE